MKATIKRFFDVFFTIFLLLLFFWTLFIVWFLACIDTRSNGLFLQKRIGQHGKIFKIYKFRTIQIHQEPNQIQISRLGRLLRNYKLDELPQLINVLKGEMSIVGPRPDIAGYYDLLSGEHRKILELKPGLTSLASLKYYNEDELLGKQEFPLLYNDKVIFPDKVQLNLDYYYQQSIWEDWKIILRTIVYVVQKIK